MKEKKLEKLKELLIIVDMINGFVKEGALADTFIQHTILEQIKLIEETLLKKEGLMFIQDSHPKESAEFKRYPEHCVEGTYESEVIAELKKYQEYALNYKKNSTSTIFAPNFMKDIEKMKELKQIVIVGCCTDICVMNLAIPLQNYFDQYNKEINIIIPENAVETYNAPWHNREEYNEMAFKLMEQSGIKVLRKQG